jgi:hypothetical protein
VKAPTYDLKVREPLPSIEASTPLSPEELTELANALQRRPWKVEKIQVLALRDPKVRELLTEILGTLKEMSPAMIKTHLRKLNLKEYFYAGEYAGGVLAEGTSPLVAMLKLILTSLVVEPADAILRAPSVVAKDEASLNYGIGELADRIHQLKLRLKELSIQPKLAAQSASSTGTIPGPRIDILPPGSPDSGHFDD